MEETTATTRPVRVLVADDEAMVRAGVRAILARDPHVVVVAEAGDGHEALALAGRHRPDVVLLDIQMPGLDGLTAVGRFRRKLPAVGVIMLTTFGQDDHIARALEEGADGFLLKADDPRELLAGVRAVGAGGAYLSPRVAGRVIAGIRAHRAAHPHRSLDRLTERERDVLAGLGAGLSNAEIAGRAPPRRGHGEGTRQRGTDEAGRAQSGGGGHRGARVRAECPARRLTPGSG
ncbi:two component system response regulator [Streptomyces sp. C]|nr:two component system response regulator [Streptomyces sp. C]